MSTVYKRKRISSLDDLDKEEARLRKKAKKIEKEWVQILDPQQLAIDFALGFFTNKVMGKGSPLKFIPSLFSSKKKANKEDRESSTKEKNKKSKAGKIIKGVGIALIAIQAVRMLVSYKKKQNKKKESL
ncbi:hypothetical protein F0919_03730 [Taibaiella lutea]|uniref:Uncharacterized protein n=1 Tax=Taibaiella lutea TaxID=2608001 RepID=A0A5M6CS59_9BACT|nr:hypothetical protein [Taibaiella lutea]KAA5536792.1 hypothetical protein F0919_03730 [Taibaiella lutea]